MHLTMVPLKNQTPTTETVILWRDMIYLDIELTKECNWCMSFGGLCPTELESYGLVPT